MKNIFLILFLFAIQFPTFGENKIDSLLTLLKTDKTDTNKVNHLIILCAELINTNPDSSLIIGNEALRLSERINWQKGIVRSHFQRAIVYQSRQNYSHSLQESLIALEALKPLEKNPSPNPLIVVLILKLRILNSTAGDYLFLADYANSLDYDFRALQLAEKLNNKNSIAFILNKIGGVYVDLGNYPKALDYCLKGLKMDEALGDTNLISSALLYIGNIYLMQEDNHKALDYYLRALEMVEEIHSDNIVPITAMIGGAYHQLKDYPKALDFLFKALKAGEKLGSKYLIATSNSNIGLVYNEMKDYPKSLDHSFRALKMFEEIGNKEGTATTLLIIGSVYNSTNKYAEAETNLLYALAIMDSIGTLHPQKTCENELSELYEKTGDHKKALKYYKMSMVSRDSLFNLDKAKELTRNEMNFAFEKKELERIIQQKQKDLIAKKETEKQRLIKNGAFIVLAIVLIFALIFFFQRKRISKEKKRSDVLLLNILPAEVADELKDKGESEAKLFDNVTVLFTDFKSFTTVSEKLTAKELVSELHTCFKAFDEIIGKYRIEKIKTVGDAYLAVSGLPLPNPNHAEDIVKAAIEIKDFMLQRNLELQNSKLETFELRIGINTGPVVAGIVGIKKFAYDIWGDTVNIAARMEQNSEAGKINISGITYELVREKFTCIYRGKIEAKNKGEIDMYFVEP